jgi:serine/threonine protein kinase
MDAGFCSRCDRAVNTKVRFGLCSSCLLESLSTRSGVFDPGNSDPLADQLRQEFRVGEGRFKLVETLGEGGMGHVWLADDLLLDGKQVALKFVNSRWGSSQVFINQLRQELVRTRSLQGRGIVKVHDWHQPSDEPPFISMEYVPGMSLAAILRENGCGLPYRRLHPIFIQICEGLISAHDSGIVHRDIKPANILVHKEGGAEYAKLSDFGIGRLIGDHHTGAGGTLAYMSPAQTMGEPPTIADDIFSLGATMYELLSGQLPFGTKGVLQGDYRRLEALANSHNRFALVPGPILKLIAHCIQRDPQYRPESVLRILQKLKHYPPLSEQLGPRTDLRPEPDETEEEKDKPTLPSQQPRNRWGLGITTLLALGFLSLHSPTRARVQHWLVLGIEAIWPPLQLGATNHSVAPSSVDTVATKQTPSGSGTIHAEFSSRLGGSLVGARYALHRRADDGKVVSPLLAGSIVSSSLQLSNVQAGPYLFLIDRGAGLRPFERSFNLAPDSVKTLVFGGVRSVDIAVSSTSGNSSYLMLWRQDFWADSRPSDSRERYRTVPDRVSLMAVEGRCQITLLSPPMAPVVTNVWVNLTGRESEDKEPIRVALTLP